MFRGAGIYTARLLRGVSLERASTFSPSILRSSIKISSVQSVRFQSKPAFVYKTRRQKTPEELKEEEAERKYQEAINSGSWVRKWGAITGSHAFDKKATKYYVALYFVFFLYGLNYFKKLYKREVEKKDILDKRDQGHELSEYEKLRVRELSNDLLRTTDMMKLKAYYKLKLEYEAALAACGDDEEKIKALGEFNPQPKDIENLIEYDYREKVEQPKDLTDFYDNIAGNYDSEINMEEKFSFMGSRRKWLMKHVKGDVLEVACGTGRNIKYLDPNAIDSITFLDTSSKMMEVTYEKFKKAFPDYKKVKFVVGKAENLLDLAQQKKDDKTKNDIKKVVKYDTIIETFGLCSHEDPVTALQNMMKLLKPGGRVILLEHGRGSYDFINDKLDQRAHKHSETWGCRWNLDIGELVDKSGLEITEEKRHHFGTTWCIVAKRPGDVLDIEELGFIDKYFTTRRTNFDSSNGPNDTHFIGNSGKK